MVVDIWNDEFYDDYCLAIDWNGDRIAKEQFRGRKDDFLQASLHIVRELDRLFELDPERFQQKIDELREAKQLLQENGLTSKDRVWKRPSKWNLFARFSVLLLTVPIALFGFLNGLFPLLINKKLKGCSRTSSSSPRYGTFRDSFSCLFSPCCNRSYWEVLAATGSWRWVTSS